MADKLSHIDDQGQAGMVDVSDKSVTKREATARSVVRLPAKAVAVLEAGTIPPAAPMPPALPTSTPNAPATSSPLPSAADNGHRHCLSANGRCP